MIELEKKYPIAEIFTSCQGEGQYAGMLMTFIRLAGCTVGKPYTQEERLQQPELFILQNYQEKCTDWHGDSFTCDTNYKMTLKLTVSEIVREVKAPRACLTGGEPMMHDLVPLLTGLTEAGIMTHMETSGTIELSPVLGNIDHIAVSPKKDYLDSALIDCDELKILVGASFNEESFLKQFQSYIKSGKVYIQPINDEHTLDMVNVRKCIQLQLKYPYLNLSIQMHKVVGVR
jgi:7-carboxy-7-deazaguanine synthase